MKPLPFLCAIIGLNILLLPGLCESSSERGNFGVCPQSLGTSLAPSPRVSLQTLPGLQEGCFRWVETIPAFPPSLCPWRGRKGLYPHIHAWEWVWRHKVAMPGCDGGLPGRHPRGLRAGALRQMKSEPQMRRSKSRRGQM